MEKQNKKQTVRILFWFLSPAENEAVYRGGCGGWVDVQWAWHYDQGLLRFFIPWANWCLFLISGHFFFFLINLFNFYLYSIRLTFFYYTYICFYECMNLPFWVSIFCSELWPQLGFFLNSVSHYSYFYTGVCSEKGHLRRSSSKFILSQHFFILLESG